MFYPILIEGNNRHSKMGQKVQHSASCMLTKSCYKAVFSVTMKICLTSMIFAILVSTEVIVIYVFSSNDNGSITSQFTLFFSFGFNIKLFNIKLLNVHSHLIGEACGRRGCLQLKVSNLTKRFLIFGSSNNVLFPSDQDREIFLTEC